MELVRLSREVKGTTIPDGVPVTLPAGTEVMITQALGGAFTLQTDRGYLVRIEGKDADAIGRTAQEAGAVADDASKPLEERVWEQLRTCYDPEIPVNIVELGLVYEMKVKDGDVYVKMSLTAPGCGMGDILKADAQQKLTALTGVTKATVELTLEPPWDPSRMSEAARLQLGMF